MSSSASTSAFSSFFTSTFTKDGLPLYNDVFTSAPLLDETFSSSIFAGATILRLEYDKSNSSGYSFFIRNSLGCLQAKGEVDGYSNIKLQNVNGTEMLKITKRNETNEPKVQTFEISHQNRSIGTVKVTVDGPASTCLRIIHNSAYPENCVRSLKIGDFTIYRPNSMSNPICNIQMPNADVYNSEEYDGTIIFHRETGINADEQLLCTAAAIAFKVAMKRKTTMEDCAGKACGYGLGIAVVILIIFAVVLWISHLERGNCLRRKAAGFSNYVNREC
ncbi:uncharacterized protein LOC119076758 [Bradysia coprophila]|uniref:uncharacterized protein LOC119076758 n=1 Tax=Bradysia coprophila TaxID=38358 RepID=UPI00187DCDD5|nr:uncharacterized protein LOC119076758 [Bradysia coprophila]